MTAKHTPGPWEVEWGHHDYETDSYQANISVASWNNPASVARVFTSANARLIAAAPNLLAALEAIHAHLENGDSANATCEELARAAIAKATS